MTSGSIRQPAPWAPPRGARSIHITLPQIRPGIIAGFLFAFITSFDDLTIALFVSGGNTSTLPRQMWNDLLLQVNPTLAAVSRYPGLRDRVHHHGGAPPSPGAGAMSAEATAGGLYGFCPARRNASPSG